MVVSVITGGEAPHKTGLVEAITQARLVIAADSGFDVLTELQLTPDWIVGDMDSLTRLNQLLAFPAEKIQLHPRHKDFTDTELAIELALMKGASEIYVFGGSNGRMDHFLANLALVSRTPQIRRWYTGREIGYVVDDRWSAEGQIGDLISIFPLGKGPWKIHSDGLVWPLEGLDWTWNFSLSNEFSSLHVNFNVVQGRFLVLRPQVFL